MEQDTTALTTRLSGLFVNGSSASESSERHFCYNAALKHIRAFRCHRLIEIKLIFFPKGFFLVNRGSLRVQWSLLFIHEKNRKSTFPEGGQHGEAISADFN